MATPKKRKKRKPFWKDIKFKYRLTITNENTLEEVASLYVSKLNGISILLFVLLGLFLVAALIVSFTPLRNYLPGYMNSEVREQVVNNALRADSLQQVLERQNLYVMNIQDIFRGDIKTDTVQSMDSLTLLREDSLMERTQREADFRKKYEEAEKYNLTNRCRRTHLLPAHTRPGVRPFRCRGQTLRYRHRRQSRRERPGHAGRHGADEQLYSRDGLRHRRSAPPGLRVRLQALRLSAQSRG